MAGNYPKRSHRSSPLHPDSSSRRREVNDTAKSCVWKPTIPSWEREFCLQAGLFTSWDKFKEIKKYIHLYPKVMEWDDSAGEEAFNNAKSRFKAQHVGTPCNHPLPDMEMYAGEIDWETNIDGDLDQLYQELEWLAILSQDENEEEEEEIRPFPDWWYTPIEDIQPSGWDVDDTELYGPVLLTGLIVGD